MGPDIFYFKEGNVMALDRYIALIIAVIFLIYGYTAFFEAIHLKKSSVTIN